MAKIVLSLASVFGALSVMIGAFGAHGLNNHLNKIGRNETFETAVKYQFYHTFLLLALGMLLLKFDQKIFLTSAWITTAGILVFSGSLYILCLTNVPKWGAVTPIGGLLLITGWILLFIGVIRNLP